jgi:hypothetical protein
MASGGRDIGFTGAVPGEIVVNYDGGAPPQGQTRKDQHAASW